MKLQNPKAGVCGCLWPCASPLQSRRQRQSRSRPAGSPNLRRNFCEECRSPALSPGTGAEPLAGGQSRGLSLERRKPEQLRHLCKTDRPRPPMRLTNGTAVARPRRTGVLRRIGGPVDGRPSFFSQSCTVRTSRQKYAAISLHESKRSAPSMGRLGTGVGRRCSGIASEMSSGAHQLAQTWGQLATLPEGRGSLAVHRTG